MAFRSPTNLTSIQKMFDYAEETSGGSFYIMIPISLYLVVFLWLKGKGYHTADCMMAASFIASIASAFLYFMQVIHTTIFFWTVIGIAVSALLAFWWRVKE